MHLTFSSPEEPCAKRIACLTYVSSVLEDGCGGQERTVEHMLRSRLDAHLADLAARYQAHKMESLYFIREWISDNIGVPTAGGDDMGPQSHEKRISYNIARRLCHLLSAELSTIYRYNAGTRELRVIGFYHNRNCVENWKESFPNIMEKAELGLT